MKRVAFTFNALAAVLAVAASFGAAPGASGAPMSVPFVEPFTNGVLDSAWKPHLDGSNQVALEAHALTFRAHRHASAHIQREFGADLVRLSCGLKTDAGGAPALLVLSWGTSDFIQFGLNSPLTGRLNVREVLGTYPHEHEVGALAPNEWRYVAVELAQDCIRYLASKNGTDFELLLLSGRPARFAGAPKVLALGQDWDGKLFARPSPFVLPPSNQMAGLSAMRELRLVALEPAARSASAAERRLLNQRQRDLAGEQELAGSAEPSFESVRQHFPPLKWSREVLGVKDHPFDIGVAPDGSLQLNDNIATFKGPTAHFEINGYRFGSSDAAPAKQLENGWMPIVTCLEQHDALQLEQTLFGWTKEFSPDEPLFGYVQVRAKNPGDSARAVELKLVFTCASNMPAPLAWSLNIPPGGSQCVSLRVPYKILESPATEIAAEEFSSKLAAVSDYWKGLVAAGSRFELPEPRVQNAYRAWIAYNFLNVAKRNGILNVCDGSGFYGQVYGYSAALACNGLDLLGYPSLAETYCDALLSFVQTNGLLAVNFGSTDTGTALWMMAEHYWLTQDKAWLSRVAPKMRLMCGWIVTQRRLSLAKAATEPAVTRGLIRSRSYADLLHPAADYFSNGYLWKGLDATARVFPELGLQSEAAQLQQQADAYRRDIEASMSRALFTERGQKILPMIPDTRELWKESNGSANGYYGLIAPCLLEIGLPAPADPKAKLITDALEQRGGLVAGLSQFHSMADHAYTYGYWLNCLQRDQVKPAILGLYASLAYGMSPDTFSAVECTMIRTGENYWMLPHTYSNTQQLRLLRNLLVREEGDTLWLGQAIPRDWLAPGKRVAVTQAPTSFGPVSYAIEANADGSIRVQLSPPLRHAPKELLLRLREPGQRKIARINTAGTAKVTFKNETIRLSGVRGALRLEVAFR